MDQKFLALIATIAIATTSLVALQKPEQLSSDFEVFKLQYNKVYNSEEEHVFRMAVYAQNIAKINNHNAKESSYVQGENQFTDMTQEEFRSMYLTYKSSDKVYENVYFSEESDGEVNWVTKGDVSRVKNQGSCGSCWAFSAVGSLESASAIFGTGLGDFSEQQLVDCSYSQATNWGCGGGRVDWSYDYYLNATYICSESSYPYIAAYHGYCMATQVTPPTCDKIDSFKLTGYKPIKKGDITSLSSACDQNPVAVAVAADGWISYKSGIYDQCDDKTITHGVLLVGYTKDIWLIKNSWGQSWGENGYMRMTGGKDCDGITQEAFWPQGTA